MHKEFSNEFFLQNGYCEFKLDNFIQLDELRKNLIEFSSITCEKNITSLEQLHLVVDKNNLNIFRQKLIKYLNLETTFRIALENKIISMFTPILGPDLAIQKSLNLVISIPEDNTSQIPLHCDTFTGHSPFELTLWLPLTQVAKTQSMFILPLSKWNSSLKETYLNKSHENLKNDFIFFNMSFGDAAIFWHALPHGNIVNSENLTRVSLNIRVKNIFSPYGEKKLGDYFKPLQLSPFASLAIKHGSV